MSFRYFAYGSNLWLPRMVARCASARFVSTAVVVSWRAVYDKPSLDGSAKLNLRPDPESTVSGVVYEIDDGDRAALDAAEPAYEPVELSVGLAYIYRGEPATAAPFDWYVELVVAGARANGMSPLLPSRARTESSRSRE
jgi:hypothetical protein